MNRNLRSLLLLFLLVVSFLALPTLFDRTPAASSYIPFSRSHFTHASYTTSASVARAAYLSASHINLQAVVDAAARTVADAAARLDTEKLKEELGIDLRGATLERYETDLRRTYEDFFAPPTSPSASSSSSSSSSSASRPLLDEVLSKISFIPSLPTASSATHGGIPQYIYTTDTLTPEELPDQFQSWITLNPEWTTMFVNDEEIDTWLAQSFPSGQEGVLREVEGLPKDKGVVRADLFRYLVLLLNGGIYTDTDTACVLPIHEWARDPARQPMSPLLDALPQLLHLAATTEVEGEADPDPDLYSSTDESHVSAEAAIEEPPSLVIALEVDAPASERDWRGETFVRGIQIVQWTIMAKKGHPVLLDVLGHALRTARRVREGDDGPNILDWTGPGVFTDAVFRYLLVRYGFHPMQISGINHPVRIGDVVILPADSFRADASEGWQGEDRAVWHGFYGRWKNGK